MTLRMIQHIFKELRKSTKCRPYSVSLDIIVVQDAPGNIFIKICMTLLRPYEGVA
jgi:hypothetical protein